MAHIAIQNTKYYYERQGQGPSLVLIAGYASDHHFWDLMLPPLCQHFDVIRFDNRGVGQTKDNQQPLHLDIMAQETAELIQALDLQNPIIVGQSMGGIIAQIIAQQHPSLIQKLIILNSATAISIRSQLALEGFITLLKEEAPINTVIDASMPWFYSSTFLREPKNRMAVKQAIMSNPYPQTLQDLERQFHALSTYNATSTTSIHVPTLVIASTEDIICVPKESKALADNIADAAYVTLESGHSSPIEAPLEVSKIIIHYLS